MLLPDEFTDGVLSEIINKTWTSFQLNKKFVLDGKDLLPLQNIFDKNGDFIYSEIAEQVYVPAIDLHNESDEFGTRDIKAYLDFEGLDTEGKLIKHFEKQGFLLYDGLHAAAFGVGSYIYRGKGIRFFWFNDGTIGFSSVHGTIDQNGFSLHHEIVDEAKLENIQNLSMYWENLNTEVGPIDGTEDSHFLLYSLANINVPYEKTYFLEYLVDPVDVRVLSKISREIRSSLWKAIFKYATRKEVLEKIDKDDFFIFLLRFMRSVGVEPSADDLLSFFENLVSSIKDGLSVSQISNLLKEIQSQTKFSAETLKKQEDDATESIKSFKNFIERQSYKDIYVAGKPQENIARALLQSHLKSRSYREIPVRGGQTDILSFTNNGRYLYEAKIWRGKEYHEQGLRELEEYIKGENDDGELKDIFYVVFDPSKKNVATSFVGGDHINIEINKKKVQVVIVNICLPTPSKK